VRLPYGEENTSNACGQHQGSENVQYDDLEARESFTPQHNLDQSSNET